MGIIQDFSDLVGKLSFYDIVYEWQQGLYNRGGCFIEKQVRRLKGSDLKKIVEEEEKIIQKTGWYPFKKVELPNNWRRKFLTGRPLHPERFSKILKGIYFYWPIIDDIVKDSIQERVLNVGSIKVLTTDVEPKTVMISCNLNYQIMDLYRTFTAVHNYEESLNNYTVSTLAEKAFGKALDEWKKPEVVEAYKKAVLEELRKTVTEKWGLRILKLNITDVALCTLISDGSSFLTTAKYYTNPP